MASGEIDRATAEVRQARIVISTQSNKLEIITQLKMPIESLDNNVAFYKPGEECLENELAKATAESTCFDELFDSMRAQTADLRKKLTAKQAVFNPII